MEGWVDLGYPAMHPPGVKLAISQSQVRRPNHYTTDPFTVKYHVHACEEWRMSRPAVGQLSATSVRVSWSLPLPAGSSVAAAVRAFKIQYRWIDKNQDSASSQWQTAADSVSPTHTYYDVTRLRTGVYLIFTAQSATNECCSYHMM